MWPVLILERAQLGDLKSFMNSEQGRRMDFEERLSLCTDVGSALITMHQCRKNLNDFPIDRALLTRN